VDAFSRTITDLEDDKYPNKRNADPTAIRDMVVVERR